MKKKYYILICILLVAVIGITTFDLAISKLDFMELSGWHRVAYAIFNREKLEKTQFVGEDFEGFWNETDEYRLENTAVL